AATTTAFSSLGQQVAASSEDKSILSLFSGPSVQSTRRLMRRTTATPRNQQIDAANSLDSDYFFTRPQRRQTKIADNTTQYMACDDNTLYDEALGELGDDLQAEF